MNELGGSFRYRRGEPDPGDILRRAQVAGPLGPIYSREATDSIERGLGEATNRLRGGAQIGLVGGLMLYQIARQAWDVLHSGDNACVADLAPASMPRVPSRCASHQACRDCYADAQARLNRTRVNLEKLRCIYTSTKQYSERALSFGDGVSTIHAVQALAWQQERRKIEKALAQLNQSYDQKYQQFMGSLAQDLEAISQCEERFYGKEDWYGRYGFMFYTFMQDRYRR
ncbi:MAG: hypothetical protein HYS05_11690 [Acidobacteria bacterium]|nr:hypothetical protein [Acidobacteriota bacterium]